MTQFSVETIDNLSNTLLGPIDKETGSYTIHPSFLIEAEDQKEAFKIAQERFPNNVAALLEYAED